MSEPGRLTREELQKIRDALRATSIPLDENWQGVILGCPHCKSPVSTTLYKDEFHPAEGNCPTCGAPVRFRLKEGRVLVELVEGTVGE